MLVAVGSTNPTKIEPVKQVFSHHFKKVEVVSADVKSGVSEQPMSVDEMYKGALNRAKRALKKIPGADFGVGIEGGIHKYSYGHFENSIVVIVDKKGRTGIGASAGLIVPEKVVKKIKSGKNLEEVTDELFGTRKIGEGIGMHGLFSNGVVPRAEGVRHGVAFAMARFLHDDLF